MNFKVNSQLLFIYFWIIVCMFISIRYWASWLWSPWFASFRHRPNLLKNMMMVWLVDCLKIPLIKFDFYVDVQFYKNTNQSYFVIFIHNKMGHHEEAEQGMKEQAETHAGNHEHHPHGHKHHGHKHHGHHHHGHHHHGHHHGHKHHHEQPEEAVPVDPAV